MIIYGNVQILVGKGKEKDRCKKQQADYVISPNECLLIKRLFVEKSPHCMHHGRQ